MKVLLATWGLPWKNEQGNPLDPGWLPSEDTMSWQEVTYKWKDRKMKCQTDLPLLSNSIEPDQIIVVVLDTVTESFRDNYTDLLNDVKKSFRRFLEIIEKRTPGTFMDNLRICPSYGTGAYNKARFKGELLDFFYYLYYQLATFFKNVQLKETIEIHLDLTHGINFMPTLAYRVLKDLGSLLATTRNVSLTVYNTEPFIRGGSEETVLEIHEVESVRVLPRPHFTMIQKTTLMPLRTSIDPKAHAMLMAKWVNETRFSRSLSQERPKQVIDLVNCFCSATMNGFPLAMLHFRLDKNQLNSYLKKLIHLYNAGINISKTKDGDKFLLERQYSFTRHFLNLVKTWVATVILDEVIPPKNHGDQAYSLKSLRHLKSNFLERDKRVEATVNLELDKLWSFKSKDKRVEIIGDCDDIPLDLSNWISYARIQECKEEVKGQKSDAPKMRNFNRNFLAHAGFESTAIQLKIEDEELLIRYVEEEQVQDKIREALEKGIKVTRTLSCMLE